MLKGKIDLGKRIYYIYGNELEDYKYVDKIVRRNLEEINYRFISAILSPIENSFRFMFELPPPRLQYYTNLEKDYQQKGEQNNNECCIKCPKRKCQFCSN